MRKRKQPRRVAPGLFGISSELVRRLLDLVNLADRDRHLAAGADGAAYLDGLAVLRQRLDLRLEGLGAAVAVVLLRRVLLGLGLLVGAAGRQRQAVLLARGRRQGQLLVLQGDRPR